MQLRVVVLTTLVLSICCVATGVERDNLGEGLSRAIRALAGSDAAARAAAVNEIGSIPRLGYPAYDREIRSLEWEALHSAAVAEFDSLLEALNSSDRAAVAKAADLIGELGPKGEAAAPALIRLLQNDSTRAEHWQSAIGALARVLPRERTLGPMVLPILKKTAFPMNPRPLDDPPLVLGLADEDHQNIEIAGTACAQMLIKSDRTLIELPSLLEVTSREYPRFVRLCAVAVLIQLRSDARSAVASLRSVLSDDDVAIRAYAVLALARIEGDAKLAGQRLKESKLAGEDARLVQQSLDDWFEQLDARSRMDGRGLPWNKYLDEAKSTHGFRRRSAIRDLGEWGPSARLALPTLRELLEHPDEATRQLAAEAIRKIEADR